MTAASAIARGLGGSVPLRIGRVRAQTIQLEDMPDLAGECSTDETSRRSAAADYGLSYYRLPLAVVKPRTIEDVIRVIQYANEQGLQVAMRGQAHSLSGQALVGFGIVIDSSSLNAVRLIDEQAIDAQPGALWGNMAKASLAVGRVPPIMPDAMGLTVGDTLSVGGIGETSYRLGAQVDHVLELEVVTGAGEFLTCSPHKDAEGVLGIYRGAWHLNSTMPVAGSRVWPFAHPAGCQLRYAAAVGGRDRDCPLGNGCCRHFDAVCGRARSYSQQSWPL